MSERSRRPDRRWLVPALLVGGLIIGMINVEWLNTLTFSLGALGVFAIFLKLVQRLWRYIRIRGWRRVPLLLWRDWLMWTTLVILYIGAGMSRLLDISLRDSDQWVIATNLLGLLTIGFWAYIELFEIEDPDH